MSVLSERARLAVLFATQEARRDGAAEVTPLHLVAGLLLEDEGLAAEVLTNRGVRLETVRAAAAGAGPAVGQEPADPPLGAEVERIVERACHEARWLERDHAGTAFLLLGLLHEAGGDAIRILLDAGLTEGEIRDGLARRFRRRR